jgi:hypothetical protein
VNETLHRWFSRATAGQGATACGLRYPDGSVFSKSWDAQLTDTKLNELWQRLVLFKDGCGGANAERLKWTFDSGIVTATTHTSGVMFFVLTNRATEPRDTVGIERLLVEFQALRS